MLIFISTKNKQHVPIKCFFFADGFRGFYSLKIKTVDVLPGGLKSAVGHQDTAFVLGVEMNRVNVSLKVGDVAYVAQLMGGRLPEGSTTLPEGFSFKFLRVEVCPE